MEKKEELIQLKAEMKNIRVDAARERKKCDQKPKPKMKKLSALAKKYGIPDHDASGLGLYNGENS